MHFLQMKAEETTMREMMVNSSEAAGGVRMKMEIYCIISQKTEEPFQDCR